MATVSPVALRFVTEQWKSEVPSPPHDALSVEARRRYLQENPRSYLGVTRSPEDDGQQWTPDSAAAALNAGRRTLVEMLQDGVFGRTEAPMFYVYQLDDGDHTQAGLVCGVATADYDSKTVRIHEQINQTRADHLAQHLRVVGAQSSPIAMAFRTAPMITELMQSTMATTEPMLDLSVNGLNQKVWQIDGSNNEAIEEALGDVPLYLIDGHHRAAAASTDRRTSASPDDPDHWMLSVLFPYRELRNQAFHRVLTGFPVAELEAALAERFPCRVTDNIEVVAHRKPTELALAVPTGAPPPQPGLRWTVFDVPLDDGNPGALVNIDPIRLRTHVLGPLLGMDESGSDHRLFYRPDHADLDTLGELSLGPNEVLFLMRPVSLTTLMEASDRGQVMPPKSTYFEPKVRSGLFVRLIDPALSVPVDQR